MAPASASPFPRWDPWAELRSRPEVEFRLDPIAALLGGGLYARDGSFRAIVLDPALSRRRRRTALAHELIHDERGSGCDRPDAPERWDAVVAREESAVDAEVARRMVPAHELLAMGRARAEQGGTLDPWEVADEFDVDEQTAITAVRLALQLPRRQAFSAGEASPAAVDPPLAPNP